VNLGIRIETESGAAVAVDGSRRGHARLRDWAPYPWSAIHLAGVQAS